MGHIRHHAIVITGTYGDWIDKAHKKALEIFGYVSEISPEMINGTKSFYVPPDGSKEGWEESADGDDERNKFIEWLEEKNYDDDSSPLAWAEVQYGDDNYETKITNDSDKCAREK